MNYQYSKIYAVVCNKTGEQYIGSTLCSLETRLSRHTTSYNQFKSKGGNHMSIYPIIERGDYYIKLIEEYPCINDLELRKRERYWQDKIECVNNNRAYATEEEKKQNKKQITKDWQEKIVECDCGKSMRQSSLNVHKLKSNHINLMKHYEEGNPIKWKSIFIKRSNYSIEYYEKNKEKMIKYSIEYYEKTKNKINENRKNKKQI